MHIPDLSMNGYVATGSALRAVGWLEQGHTFKTGRSSAAFTKALHAHLTHPFGVWDFMGSHQCSLCPTDEGVHGRLQVSADGQSYVLQQLSKATAPCGNGELYIPTKELCYVAPVLILHYVEAHNYSPPQEFSAALLMCPPQHSTEYLELIEPFLQYLRGKISA